MKKILIGWLFLVFVTANISKWYVDLGFRINYYVIVSLIWVTPAVLFLDCTRGGIPRGVRRLILFKAVMVATLLLNLPLVLMFSGVESWSLLFKGLTMEIINGLLIVVILLFLARLEAREREAVLGLYVAATAVCIGYCLVQAVGGYGLGVDVDSRISQYILLWSREVRTTENLFGLASVGATIRRLNGTASDPNLNGVILAIALPAILYQARRGHRLVWAAVVLACVGVILATFSNTAIPVMFLMLVIATLTGRRRNRWLSLGIIVLMFVGLVALAYYQREAVRETLEYRLNPDGTLTDHLGIAERAITLLRDHPWGIGMNNFAAYSEDLSTHNSYVRQLVELGLPGLLVMLAWLGYCLVVTVRLRTQLGWVAFSSVLALGISSMGHDLFNHFELQLAVNVLVGLACLDKEELGKNRRAQSPLIEPLRPAENLAAKRV